MDYSLLMGIQSSEYFVDTSQLPQARRDLLFTQPATSVAGPSLYHFGIIDFLQQWCVRACVLTGTDGGGIASC